MRALLLTLFLLTGLPSQAKSISAEELQFRAELASRIKYALKSTSRTQAELARAIEVDPSKISRIMVGGEDLTLWQLFLVKKELSLASEWLLAPEGNTAEITFTAKDEDTVSETEWNEEVRLRIRSAMADKSWSLRQTAAVAQISHPYFWRILNGQKDLTTFNLMKLAEALDVYPSWLSAFDHRPAPNSCVADLLGAN